MTSYSGLPDYEHARPAKLGILLVNLGTPREPTRAAVRQFLAEFLGELGELASLEGAEILWSADAVKQRRGTGGAHSLLPGAVRKGSEGSTR